MEACSGQGMSNSASPGFYEITNTLQGTPAAQPDQQDEKENIQCRMMNRRMVKVGILSFSLKGSIKRQYSSRPSA
jgi:hypothetical protein